MDQHPIQKQLHTYFHHCLMFLLSEDTKLLKTRAQIQAKSSTVDTLSSMILAHVR